VLTEHRGSVNATKISSLTYIQCRDLQPNGKRFSWISQLVFFSATIAATALRKLGVGYAVTREKSLPRGSNPDRCIVGRHANHYITRTPLTVKHSFNISHSIYFQMIAVYICSLANASGRSCVCSLATPPLPRHEVGDVTVLRYAGRSPHNT